MHTLRARHALTAPYTLPFARNATGSDLPQCATFPAKSRTADALAGLQLIDINLSSDGCLKTKSMTFCTYYYGIP